MNWTSKLVTWQKPNGELVNRIVSYNMYHIGQKNAYNWKIIDIKYYHKKKFLSEKKWDKAITRESKIQEIKFSVQNFFAKLCKQIIYIISLLISMRVLEYIKSVGV